jgi:hypothetical protein
MEGLKLDSDAKNGKYKDIENDINIVFKFYDHNSFHLNRSLIFSGNKQNFN